MKKILTILAAWLMMQNASALIVSVDGHGEVPAEGMDLMITEGEEDILSGRYTMELSGTVLATGEQLSVQITRPGTGIEDEFCCGTNCTAGNGDATETKTFTVSGPANWYAHYYPNRAYAQINYLFSDGTDTREIRVYYVHTNQAVDEVTAEQPASKMMRDGQVYILKDGQSFSVQGLPLDLTKKR